jgi:hypothetical protein
MGITHRFIADPLEPSKVLAWFRTLNAPPMEVEMARGLVLFFKQCGALAYDANGAIDGKASPIATVFLPRVRRGTLWTVGEVHFLASRLGKRFPALHKVSSSFFEWLSAHSCVYPDANQEFDYDLEGSIRNFDPPIFAFESGAAALRAGRYFVADDDTEFMLDKLCSQLRLRGVECSA